MHSDLDSKAILRRAMRAQLRMVVPAVALSAGQRVAAHLRTMPELAASDAVMAFLASGGEVDLSPLLARLMKPGRGVILPRVLGDSGELELRRVTAMEQVAPGFRGIPEPVPGECPLVEPGDVSVMLVPGLAFGIDGARLGRGGGYFDRLLAAVPRDTLRIGICHDWQLLVTLGAVPTERHDQPMDMVCTPGQLLRTGAHR